MNTEPRFVAFNLQGMNNTDKLVASLLSESINYMNETAHKQPHSYMNLSGSDVEVLSCKSMKEVAPSLGFPQERIDLISGHVFPDIILHDYNYGVEIKSTQKDSGHQQEVVLLRAQGTKRLKEYICFLASLAECQNLDVSHISSALVILP